MSNKRKAVRVAISILAAIAIWLYVDTVTTPSVSMTVRGIPVEFSGENTTLADKGLMLLSGYETTIDLKLKGPRQQLSKLDKKQLRIVASTASISEIGMQSLSYDVIYPDGVSRNSISVSWASAYSVTVTVGEMCSKDVPIVCNVTGTPKKSFFAGDVVLDTDTVTLRAQRDDLLNVSYASISVDISGAEKTVVQAAEITLYDYNDVAVATTEIRKSVKLVQVTVPILTTKEVPLAVNFRESPGAELSQATYSISPQNVTLSGEKSTLDAISVITLDTIDLTDVNGSQSFYYRIPAPEGTQLQGSEDTAVLTVSMSNVAETSVTLSSFTLERIPEGYSAEAVTQEISISLRGLSSEIAAVQAANILAVADLSSLSGEGEHTVELMILANGYNHISAVGTYQITVRLTRN